MPPDPADVYDDDLTVTDETLLFRIVNRSNCKFAKSGAVLRGGSNAFEDFPAERLHEVGAPAVAVSVYLGDTMELLKLLPADLLLRWDSSYGVVSVTAGQARNIGQGVVRWPRPDEPAHGMIFTQSEDRKTKRQSKDLALVSIVQIPPP